MADHPSQTSGDPPDDASDELGSGPVGAGDYVVRQGDCLQSIAHRFGLPVDVVWEHPDNAELREKRESPYLLLPGDRVAIPERRRRQEDGATENRHRFVLKGVPVKLEIRLVSLEEEDDEEEEEDDVEDGSDGEPIEASTGDPEEPCGVGEEDPFDVDAAYTEEAPVAKEHPYENTPCLLRVDGREVGEYETDGDGWLRASIPPTAREAEIVLNPSTPEQVVVPVKLRRLDPLSEVSGVQQRLNNLGFGCGPADGIVGPKTRSALSAFQKSAELTRTSRIDAATRDALRERHGS